MSAAVEALKAYLDEGAAGTDEGTFGLLRNRIMVLNARVWEHRVDWTHVERWLACFDGSSGHAADVERLHALYFLSQFLFFGGVEIRVLLRALYRDLFLAPLIQEVRRANRGTRDADVIRRGLGEAFARTRFLGVGSPSESGVHLLYYFRQENRLLKGQFLDTAQILERDASSASGSKLRHPEVERYVFVDDVCGSGETAQRYSDDFLGEVAAANGDARFSYFAMFAKREGLERIRNGTVFGTDVDAVFTLDETYKCLSPTSRHLRSLPPGIDADVARQVARFYGARVLPSDPTGFDDGQLLIGFHHNTPDNTLPIIWMDGENASPVPWYAIFKRYPKV